MNGLKFDFIPFGAQYYRAPTPVKSEWEKDISNIKKCGFNTIKIWAQWRWNNPGKDVYYFEDLDEIMDLAGKYDIKVIINVIFDVAPAWLYRESPDCVMITCSGRKVEPQVIAWRQVGGAPGPCYNHAESLKYRLGFLEAVVKRYMNHPALLLWDLWNEPELTCGIFREPLQETMVCYCPRCLSEFTDWLKAKYGSIEELNIHWNRNYNEWNEVEAPRNGAAFNDMIDWRMFFSFVLTRELEKRVNATKAIDGKNPVMVHTVPIPWFNAVNACNNDYELAGLCDIFGNSTGSNPFAAAFSSSCSGGKPIICAEIHALGGDTYNRPSIPSFDDIKGHILIPLARGIKGFIYWQFRTETLGREGPAWGLTAPDGSSTDWLEYNIRICDMLRENAELLLNVQPIPARVGILNSYKNQIFDWCASNSINMYCGSIMGAYMAMYKNNINADILGIEQINDKKLENYKVIYCPFPYYMDEKTVNALKRWISNGGVLISEAFFGSVSEETGLHSGKTPGFGFDEVFGASEECVITASTFKNAYGSEWSSLKEKNCISVKACVDIGDLASGDIAETFFYMEGLKCTGSAVLAEFSNGMAAVTLNNYGKGKAIMIGSLPGYAYHSFGSDKTAAFIAGLVRMGGIEANGIVKGGQARIDILKSIDGKDILIINNLEDRDLDIEISSANINAKKSTAIDLFTGETYMLSVENCSNLPTLKLKLGLKCKNIYCIS